MTLDQFLDESSMFGHEMKTALNFTSVCSSSRIFVPYWKLYSVQVALDLLVTGQEGSNLSPETKLSQREFYSELAIGVIDKILNLQRPWEQIENVKLLINLDSQVY
jgi:hypothetical protein